jgi:hypothetical protein
MCWGNLGICQIYKPEDCSPQSGQIVQSGIALVTPVFEQDAFLTYLTIVFGCTLDDVNKCN